MIMTYFVLYGELKYVLKQISPGLFTIGDDEHAIELEEYTCDQELP